MILVTGGTGGIGSILVDRLLRAPLEFKLLVREDTDARRSRERGIDSVIGDMSDRASLKHALKGVEQVLLSSGASASLSTLQGNVVDAARAAGVRKIVKLSSRGADSASDVELLRSHGQVEDRIRAAGLAHVFLRPTFMYQNFGRSIDQIIERHMLSAPISDARIAMFDARDLGDIAAIALSSDAFDGSGYYLTGPEALSHSDVARAISVAAGSRVEFENIPEDAFARTLTAQGASSDYVRITLGLYRDWKAGNADTPQSTFCEMTGRSPRPIQAFLETILPRSPNAGDKPRE